MEAKILKQVEFYFSDSNLPKDKFLLEESKKDEGWIQVSVIASFKRMKDLTEDMEQIVSAIGKSDGLLELNEDKTKVRRSLPLPEQMDNLNTSVYVKGLPTGSTIDSIEELFSKYGKVLCVRLKKDKKKDFLGSAFVEFQNEDQVKSALEQEITVGDKKLEVCSKANYFSRKNEERLEKAKKKEAAPAEEKENKPKFTIQENSLVILTNVPENANLKHLRDEMAKHGNVAFVSKDETLGVVARYHDSISQQMEEFYKTNELTFNDAKIEVRAMTSEEEAQYKENAKNAPPVQVTNKRKGNFRGRGRGKRRN